MNLLFLKQKCTKLIWAEKGGAEWCYGYKIFNYMAQISTNI